MENQTILNQNSEQKLNPAPSTNRNWLSILFTILFITLLTSTIFLFYQNLQLKQQPNKIVTEISTIPSPQVSSSTSSLSDQTIIWKTARHGGLFSYEYPSGWHVAELWQDNYAQNGIMLAIDPNPISTAPRGGPLATFEITLLNGNQNPDEILQKRIDRFNLDNYSNITKEVINEGIGTVYYYKGKMVGPMLEGEPVESYFFTFHKNPNDLINQQVVIATLALKNDPELSKMLRHIVLSFKEITQ